LTLLAQLDADTLLARPDLAEQALEGLLAAQSYRPTVEMHACVPVADMTAEAAAESTRVDQLLFGEAFDVLERQDGRVWGRARRTGSVGWMNEDALVPGAPLARFTVAATRTRLPLNALVVDPVPDLDGESLQPIGEFASDPVAVAEQMLGVAHGTGARSSLLTDGSGLVQSALFACGRACPRHSDRQAELGWAVERTDLRRGDLVIWLAPEGETAFTGHSALVLDAETLIHATGHHGGVVTEQLATAEQRYADAGFGLPAFRRL
jgi:hypothetical protein